MNSKLDKGIYSQKFVIRPHECDRYHQLLPRFLMWILQEAASNHAQATHQGYDDLIQENCAWALAGFAFNVHRMPQWKEEIEVFTWEKSATQIFIYRDFELRTSAGELLVEATSSWFILDLIKRKPIRIISYVHNPVAKSAYAHPLKRSDLPDPNSFGATLLAHVSKVSFEDLDHNNHANNVHYIRWMFDSLRDEVKDQNLLSQFEIFFIHELSCGSLIECRSWPLENEKSFLHALNHPDGGYSAIAKSIWRSRR